MISLVEREGLQEINISFSKGLNQEWVPGLTLYSIISKINNHRGLELLEDFKFHIDFNRVDFKFVSKSFTKKEIDLIKSFLDPKSLDKEQGIHTEVYKLFTKYITYSQNNVNIFLNIISSRYLKLGNHLAFGDKEDHLKFSYKLIRKYLEFAFSLDFFSATVSGSKLFLDNFAEVFDYNDFLRPSTLDNFIPSIFEERNPSFNSLDLLDREFRIPYSKSRVNNFITDYDFVLEKRNYVCYYWVMRDYNLDLDLIKNSKYLTNFSIFPQFNLYYSLVPDGEFPDILIEEGLDFSTVKYSFVLKEE